MPAGKPSQSNAMLYTVVVFVGLFIISATCAVIFYVKSEDYKSQRNDIRGEIAKLANTTEQQRLGKIIGKTLSGKSYLGTMSSYLDEMVSAITGQEVENLAASAKVNDAKVRINETMELLAQDAATTYGGGDVDLIRAIRQLKSKLDDTGSSAREMENQLNDIQDEFDLAVKNYGLEEQRLIKEKNHFQKEADKVQASYDELETLMRQSTDDQVKAYMDKVSKAEQSLKQKEIDLLQARAELKKVGDSLKISLDKLEAIKPKPDIEVAAFEPDAQIVSIDNRANLVYLDIGSVDHVYPGLTFGVYSERAPIPEDGKGKAEIEVFDVKENVSVARINVSSKKNAIVPGDVAINLIWDSKTSNNFVVTGEFDIDGDGRADQAGGEKIRQLIQRWGGKVVSDVSIKTDFVVVGTIPRALPKPTRDQIELNPTLEQRYNASLARGREYSQFVSRANMLSIPIFNQRRFLKLIGYEPLVRKSSTF